MHDVAYWREKAGIAELFCGSRNNITVVKTNAGNIFNAILTPDLPLYPAAGNGI